MGPDHSITAVCHVIVEIGILMATSVVIGKQVVTQAAGGSCLPPILAPVEPSYNHCMGSSLITEKLTEITAFLSSAVIHFCVNKQHVEANAFI